MAFIVLYAVKRLLTHYLLSGIERCRQVFYRHFRHNKPGGLYHAHVSDVK